jgi:hypothetical protein
MDKTDSFAMNLSPIDELEGDDDSPMQEHQSDHNNSGYDL